MAKQDQNTPPDKPPLDTVLSFKSVGRPLSVDGLVGEFRLMQEYLTPKKPLTKEVASRVCANSGTHLLKLLSARAETGQACLSIPSRDNTVRPKILPSTNAGDIRFCKVLFRPLEIIDCEPLSVIDHIMNPDKISDRVLSAFASVFGQDVLDTVREALLETPKSVTQLAAGEFPIIFVPRPDRRDLQITPVSPAATFMNTKSWINDLFERKKLAEVRLPTAQFVYQSISSKPQNISGAIDDSRRRLFARMPPELQQVEADIWRYLHGGSFPRWRERDVADRVLAYAERLEADKTFNNQDTRKALDGWVDRLIDDAQDFIADTVSEAEAKAAELGIDRALPTPSPAEVLLRRKWANDDNYNTARQALTSAHFKHRQRRLREKSGDSPE